MQIGFMGFGEAAFHMAAGLKDEHLQEIAAYDIVIELEKGFELRDKFIQRAKTANVNVTETPEELAHGSDTIILAVPSTFAESAAYAIIAAMKPGQILVDVCSSSPNLKEQIAEDCASREIGYVDSPMLGPLPVYGHKVPIVASGVAADRWRDAMTRFGMNIKVIDGPAGMASRIKLSRSIFTKGFEALLVETFQFARKNGVEDMVMQSISETMDKVSFRDSAVRYLAGDLVHAARRAHELDDAISMMRECGIAPLLAEGALARLNNSANSGSSEKLAGEMPKSLDEVFAIWKATGAI